MDDLNLRPGKWVYTNCADMPSKMNCQMVMMAPADQKSDLVEAAAAHAVKTHGHDDTDELKNEMEKMIKETEIE